MLFHSDFRLDLLPILSLHSLLWPWNFRLFGCVVAALIGLYGVGK